MIPKKPTEEESIEIEALVDLAETRPLTRDEKIRLYLLKGHDKEWAQYLADHGYPKE